MKKSVYLNSTLLTDFYELTMANGYFVRGFGEREVCFDMFFRSVPDGGGYAIMAGVEQLIDYLENLKFDLEDIAYLRSKNCFSEEFCSICSISNSSATYGPFRRARLFSPVNQL